MDVPKPVDSIPPIQRTTHLRDSRWDAVMDEAAALTPPKAIPIERPTNRSAASLADRLRKRAEKREMSLTIEQRKNTVYVGPGA